MVGCSPAVEDAPREYFVAIDGDDSNTGTLESPFRTINHAAQLAMPGDTVTVREGTYREWVRPARGGDSENTRIIYRAADGEDVRIVGSEPATGWAHEGDGTWILTLDHDYFGDFNPFATLSRHPVDIEEDESGDGWGWLKYGRWTHLGDVYINGEGLTERETRDEIAETTFSWHAEIDDGTTIIRANFGELDPNANDVELNHRPYAFFPEATGLSYITLQGFTIQNVASHWAPPVVYQPGAVGSNGGHHWVIENNIVMYAKAVCISIGNPTGTADPAESGQHIIRNNVILRCGQAGIAGQSWASGSIISGNHIEDINYRKEFGGWETAAIKHHMGDRLEIRGNFIRNVQTTDPDIAAAHGIWNDFRNSNWIVDANVIIGAQGNAILAEANWEGPNLYSNNVVVGDRVATYSSRGDAWVHNLFVNTPQQWVNQAYGDRAPIGDTRWMNNVFVGIGLQPGVEAENGVFADNVYLDGAEPHPEEIGAIVENTATHFAIYEDEAGVSVAFDLDRSIAATSFPLVDNESLDLPFSVDVTVGRDMIGDERTESNNVAGPFVALHAGRNTVPVHEFSPAYKKARKLIGY